LQRRMNELSRCGGFFHWGPCFWWPRCKLFLHQTYRNSTDRVDLCFPRSQNRDLGHPFCTGDICKSGDHPTSAASTSSVLRTRPILGKVTLMANWCASAFTLDMASSTKISS